MISELSTNPMYKIRYFLLLEQLLYFQIDLSYQIRLQMILLDKLDQLAMIIQHEKKKKI